MFTSGRTVHHFHTRTKTGRVRELNGAAPEAWLEISPTDAGARGIGDGDFVVVESPRGHIEVKARVCDVRPGVVFAPFHYGYWDVRRDGAPTKDESRAANELTITDWDPVSKQPVSRSPPCR
jgi:anaerobic selenocysteine-containing dehydrogenase